MLNNSFKKFYFILIILLLKNPFYYTVAIGQGIESTSLTEDEIVWSNLKPFFSVPDRYVDSFGSYRSPLEFYDGERVKTKEEWGKRRKEILQRWNGMMGEWPDLLKDQILERIDSIKKEGFTQYTVQFNWLPRQKTKGYLLIPDEATQGPAIITVFYEPETAAGINSEQKPYRDFALQLAKKGFITLSLGTSETTENKTYSLYYPNRDSATIQPLSTLAYAAANAWYALSKEPLVDSTKIGIMGHSYGGKWAMFASCLFDKFAAAVWSDPGIVFDETKGSFVNYWEPWYLGYYSPPWKDTWREKGQIKEAKGLYPKLVHEEYDLTELHALMAPRPFLVSGGYSDREDRWKALNHSIKVNKLLGFENRVGLTLRPSHSPTFYSNAEAYLFLIYYLK